MARRLIFGGTFNPVHAGHMRVAVEAAEALGFDEVEFVPSYSPHHKEGAGLLPFDLRVDLLRAAVDGHAAFRVNDIERNLPIPSITIHTLEAISRAHTDELHFLLGNREFMRLHKWVRGRDIAALCNLVIACRTEMELGAFEAAVTEAWPRAKRMEASGSVMAAFEIVAGRKAVLLELPRLEISSSLVRRRWLEGRDLAYIVPRSVIERLAVRHAEVKAIWGAPAAGRKKAT